jgi:DNA polymerase-1
MSLLIIKTPTSNSAVIFTARPAYPYNKDNPFTGGYAAMKNYRPIHTLAQLQNYLANATKVAFDFETAPLDKYRTTDKAALDAHKAVIIGISFSIAEGDAVYLPLTHRVGENASSSEDIWGYLVGLFANPDIVKIAHNLAFESQFLYARGIVVQEPCYDTIAAAQVPCL